MPPAAKTDTELRIRQLFVYPVKSLRGIAVQQWQATPRGLEHDRQWMLVMPNGRFVSQRQLPRMALIDTALDSDDLTLSAAGHGSIRLPLANPDAGVSFVASVWRDTCEVQEASQEASSWLNRVLQPARPLRLVTMVADYQRRHINPRRFDSDTLFADAAPYLIANHNSLQRLNDELCQRGLKPVDMRRFRPNLVIEGLPAFAEHHREQLRHVASGFSFRLCDPCERCVITTIDPDSGVVAANREPFNTLRDLNPMPDNPAAPAFAVNACLQANAGMTLRVGDTLL